ncbi:transposase [Liquorilactobacillus sicerae]|uniref:transposase n=1 Tax=Liquorilactobacillus sicerae TaxID=1416943 RepID=UPI003D031A28
MPEPNRTLGKHQAEIINSFKVMFSVGPIEGINCKIQALKKIYYRLKNMDHFYARTLLIVNKPPIQRSSWLTNLI